jgi:uncharacterized membrane protein YfcA
VQPPPLDLVGAAILFGAGYASGVINVMAGGGSFLTIPALIFLGLPPTMANATNRVGVLLQNVGGVYQFNRRGMLDWDVVRRAVPPALVGTVLGTWAATVVGDEATKRILAVLMVVMTLGPLVMHRSPGRADEGGWRLRGTPLALAFVLVGVYVGFLQAGVGFIILAVTSAAGFDLVRGNAVKLSVVFFLTAVSVAMFAWFGLIDWPRALALGLGNLLGGQLGVRLTLAAGHRWLRWIVTIAVLASAAKLWVSP